MATKPKLCLSSKPYTEFEVESCELNLQKSNRNSNSKNRSLVVHTIPTNANHLLLVALLEHLCTLYIRNSDSKEKLFKLLCRQLAKMKIMSPLCDLDELSPVRTQYRLNFAKLLQACVAHLNLKSQLALPSCQDPVSRFTDNRLPSWRQPSLDLSQCMNFHTSRYRDEYTELDTLGKGAYGSVYKVKHKLDDGYYAVKKIVFQDNTPAVWSKTLREVKHLADLNHPSIIRYYTAWLEYDLPLFNMQETHHKIQEENNLLEVAYPNENTKDSIFDKASSQSSGSSIIFEDASALSAPNTSKVKYWDQYNQKDSRAGKSLPKQMHAHGSTSYSERVVLDHCHVVLHIQMELCNETLQDWLTTRNGRVQDSKDVYGVVDKNINAYILKEVLHGVHYLHSHNLIHRDLKPSNIFLNAIQDTGKMSVKIGDFGLIRHNINSNGDRTQPVTPLTPAPGLLEELQLDTSGIVLTGGVGTTIYASPEQLVGAQYDFKSDMYSIGLILFEMFQPFYTSMERTKTLTDLRRSLIPAEFTERWPTLSKAVKELINLDPDKRPTASTVLKGPLFTSDKAEVTKKLQAELEEKNQLLRSYASRIQELEMLLTQRDNEMKQLRKLLDSEADTDTSR